MFCALTQGRAVFVASEVGERVKKGKNPAWDLGLGCVRTRGDLGYYPVIPPAFLLVVGMSTEQFAFAIGQVKTALGETAPPEQPFLCLLGSEVVGSGSVLVLQVCLDQWVDLML